MSMAIRRGGLRILDSFPAEGVKDFLDLSLFSIANAIEVFVLLWE
jgi:hypothetical protein